MTKRHISYAVASFVITVCVAQQVGAAKPFVLTLERNMSCGDGNVNGRLLVADQEIARTLEPGPEGNRIPAGQYDAAIRSDGELGWRIELLNVKGWEHVEIHLGNYPSNSRGCILVGVDVKTATDPKTNRSTCSAFDSKAALAKIQKAMQAASGNGVSSQPVSIKIVVR